MGLDSNNNFFPSLKEIYQYLSGFVQGGGEKWEEENKKYLDDHLRRFYETLKFLPAGNPGDKLLELGAAPYFFTLLLKKYTNYSIYISNYLTHGGPEQSSIKLSKRDTAEDYVFPFENYNVEIDYFPYPNDSFDVVCCCELIEHLVLDPTHMLLEIHRILMPGGKLLMTTPNVLVLRNVISLLKNRKNIYYPYSSYGVYGRHNREWTLEELKSLLNGCGYSIENTCIVDTFPHSGYSAILKKMFPSLRDVLIVIGCAENAPKAFYPAMLYDSAQKQYSSSNPIPSRLQNS